VSSRFANAVTAATPGPSVKARWLLAPLSGSARLPTLADPYQLRPRSRLRWGAWYLQSHLGQCRHTGLRPDPYRISLGCIASPTSKAG
jgi:hypothetical protein